MQNVKQTKLKKQSTCSLIFIEITGTSAVPLSLLWTYPLAAQVRCGASSPSSLSVASSAEATLFLLGTFFKHFVNKFVLITSFFILRALYHVQVI